MGGGDICLYSPYSGGGASVSSIITGDVLTSGIVGGDVDIEDNRGSIALSCSLFVLTQVFHFVPIAMQQSPSLRQHLQSPILLQHDFADFNVLFVIPHIKPAQLVLKFSKLLSFLQCPCNTNVKKITAATQAPIAYPLKPCSPKSIK